MTKLKDMEKSDRLLTLVGALCSKDQPLKGVLAKWRKDLWPFCEERGKVGLPEQLDEYETDIMNEDRLYKALGKNDARSVLGIWRRFRLIVTELAELTEADDD